MKTFAEVLEIARRHWLGNPITDDEATDMKNFLVAKYPRFKGKTEIAVDWILIMSNANAPSRYKNVEYFVAKNKLGPHLPLGGRWPVSGDS